MTEQEIQRNISRAETFRVLSCGPEYYFWMGYLRGLRQNYQGNQFDTVLEYNMDGDDLESQGYRAGFAGVSARDALAVAKKGTHRAGTIML